MRLSWLLAALVLCAILAGLHIYGLAHFWYWRYRWFDTPMHILAGVITGVLIVSYFKSFRPITFLVIVAVVALGWELFEYIFKISTGQPNYIWDTSHDILNDALGAIAVYIVARFTVWRSPRSEISSV